MVRRVLIWLRLEKIVIEWTAVIALAFAGLIAFNIFMALQPHRSLNVLLQYHENYGTREFPFGVKEDQSDARGSNK
jgi:hypothetical protein